MLSHFEFWFNSLLLRCVWRRLSSPTLDLLLGSLTVFYNQDAFIFASGRHAFSVCKGLSCYLAFFGKPVSNQAFAPCIVAWLIFFKIGRIWNQMTSKKQIHGWMNLVSVHMCNKVTSWGNKFRGKRIWSQPISCEKVLLVSHCTGCPPPCPLTSLHAGYKHKHVPFKSIKPFFSVLCATHTEGL